MELMEFFKTIADPEDSCLPPTVHVYMADSLTDGLRVVEAAYT
jgi:hypothetical protein